MKRRGPKLLDLFGHINGVVDIPAITFLHSAKKSIVRSVPKKDKVKALRTPVRLNEGT